MKMYRKKGTTPMRPYEKGEDLTGVSISIEDWPAKEGDMIAHNPDNPDDQWLVAESYFNKHYEPAE